MTGKILNTLFGSKHSIARRLLIVVFSIYLFIAVVITLSQMFVEYRQAHNDISRSIKIIEQTTHDSLRNAIWNLNADQIEAISNGLINLPEIGGVTLHDENSTLLVQAGLTDIDQSDYIFTQIPPYSQVITFQHKQREVPIGKVTLFASPNAVLDRVGLGFILLIISAFIKTLCLWLIFSIITRKLLQKPLTKLTEHIKSLDLKQHFSAPKIDIGVQGKNELTQLNDSFTDLTGRLHDYQSELTTTNLNLEQRVIARTEELSQKNAALEKAKTELEEMSETDPLTLWNNRRFFEQHITADTQLIIRTYDEWIKQGSPKPLPSQAGMVLYLLDIDHFKAINDKYGHAAGDTILKKFSEAIKPLFRQSDYLVRWGGEEFLVVARYTELGSIEAVANRILSTISEQDFNIDNGETINISCSVGIAHFPFDAYSPDNVNLHHTVEIADKALYLAKENGRNAWVALLKNPDKNTKVSYLGLINNCSQLIASDDVFLKTSLKNTLSFPVKEKDVS